MNEFQTLKQQQQKSVIIPEPSTKPVRLYRQPVGTDLDIT